MDLPFLVSKGRVQCGADGRRRVCQSVQKRLDIARCDGNGDEQKVLQVQNFLPRWPGRLTGVRCFGSTLPLAFFNVVASSWSACRRA